MNFDFKIGHARMKSFNENETRYARHHSWVAVGVGVAGVAASAYGANKQAKSVKDAASQNNASQAEQNAQAWSNYLMTRGLNPAGAAPGQIPQNAQAINSRLPLWANANFATPGASAGGWRKRGSTGAAGTLSMSPVAGSTPMPTAVAPAASAPSANSQKLKDALIGNPLGIGGKDRSFLDPLGIF